MAKKYKSLRDYGSGKVRHAGRLMDEAARKTEVATPSSITNRSRSAGVTPLTAPSARTLASITNRGRSSGVTPRTTSAVAGPPRPPSGYIPAVSAAASSEASPFWARPGFASIISSLSASPSTSVVPYSLTGSLTPTSIPGSLTPAQVGTQRPESVDQPIGYRAPLGSVDEFEGNTMENIRDRWRREIGGSDFTAPTADDIENDILGNSYKVLVAPIDEETKSVDYEHLVPFLTEAGRPTSDLELINAMRAQGKSDAEIKAGLALKNITLNLNKNAIYLAMGPVEVEYVFSERNASPATAILQSAMNVGLLIGEAISNSFEIDLPIKRDAKTGKVIIQSPIRFESPAKIERDRKLLNSILANPLAMKENKVMAQAKLNLLEEQEKKMLSDHQRLEDARTATFKSFAKVADVIRQAGVNSRAAAQADTARGQYDPNAVLSGASRSLSYGANLIGETVKSLFTPAYTINPDERKAMTLQADTLEKSMADKIKAMNKGTVSELMTTTTYGNVTINDLERAIVESNDLPRGTNISVTDAQYAIIEENTRIPTAEQLKAAMKDYPGATADEVFSILYRANIEEPTLKQISEKMDEMYGLSGTDLDSLYSSLSYDTRETVPYEPSDAEVQAARIDRIHRGGLSLAREDIIEDLKKDHMYERPMTEGERKKLEQGIVADAQKAIDITYALKEHDPRAAATWDREPWRKEAFDLAVAHFLIQTGRMPTDAEVRTLKQEYSNPGTEMLAESMFDVTNFLPGLGVLDEVLPGMKGVRTIFKESFSSFIDKVPVVGWLARESASSVGGKIGNSVNSAFLQVVKAYSGQAESFEKALPVIGDVLRRALGKSDDEARQIFESVSTKGLPDYLPGMENLSYNTFKKLRDITNVEGGGIDPSTWTDLYKRAVSASEQEMFRNAEHQVKHQIRSMKLKVSDDEYKKMIARELSDTASDPTKNSNIIARFSQEFKKSFLSSHRVRQDITGNASPLLEDTFFGQLVQKIYMLGDDLEHLPAFKRIQDALGKDEAYKHMLEVYNIKKKGMTSRQKAVLWSEMRAGVEKGHLSFGDTINKMIVSLGTEVNSKTRAKATKIASSLEDVHQATGYAYQLWAMAVLSMNPRWYIQNLIDTTGRSFLFGGNPLEDMFMLMFGTHSSLAKKLGDIPLELGQNLARQGQDEAYTVTSRYLHQGFQPLMGPYSWWKYEYDRIMEEGTRNIEELPAIVQKMMASKLDGSPASQAARRLMRGIGAGIAAIPGASSDFNTAIEFTVRLRMFSREYFKLLDTLSPQFKNMGTEDLSPTVKKLAMQIWDESGNNPSKMADMVDNIISDVAPDGTKLTPAQMKEKSWSLLFGQDVDESMAALTAQEKQVFLADIGDRFERNLDSIKKAGRSITEEDVNKFIDDHMKAVQNEIQQRISDSSDTMGRNVDGFGAPDVSHKPPTMEKVANMIAGIIRPNLRPSPPKVARNTPNFTIKGLMDKINTAFTKPATSSETLAARSLKHKSRHYKEVVQDFARAMEPYGAASLVPGKEVTVSMVDGQVSIAIGEELMKGTRKEMVTALTEGTIKAKGTIDHALLDSVGASMDDYVSAYNMFMTHNGPVELLRKDKNLFLIVAGQLTDDTHMRSILENLKGEKLSFEGTRMLDRSGMNIYDLVGEDWKRAVDDLDAQFSKTPPEIMVKGNQKALSTLELREYIIKDRFNDPELVKELENYLAHMFVADGNLADFMYHNFPGPFKARGLTALKKDKVWRAFWEMKGEIYDRSAIRNREILKVLQSQNPEEAKRILMEFNQQFSEKYLESLGFTVTKNIDGGVEQFSFKLGDRSIAKGRPTQSNPIYAKWDTKQMEESFFSPNARRSLSRDTTVMVDANRLLDPNMSAIDQMSRALVNSFGLTVPQSRAYALTIREHVDMMSARSGIPMEELLGRLGFARMEGSLTINEGLQLARTGVKDGTERFVFYGFGQQNFRGLTAQMSQMFYEDLTFLAKHGDAGAVEDLRTIRNMITKLSNEAVIGNKLSTQQSEHFADIFTKWVENGVTENPKLKKTFMNFRRDYIAKPYKNILEGDVMTREMDLDMLSTLDRTFTGAKLDEIPKANSFAIRSLANNSGININETEILKLINNHQSVTGMNDKEGFLKLLGGIFTSKEEAGHIYDMTRIWAAASGVDMNIIHFVPGEEGSMDIAQLLHLIKSNPLLSQSLDQDMIERMVGAMYRNKKYDFAGQLRNSIMDASSNEEKRAFIKEATKYDQMVALDVWEKARSRGEMFQSEMDETMVKQFVDSIYKGNDTSGTYSQLKSAIRSASTNDEKRLILKDVMKRDPLAATKLWTELHAGGQMYQQGDMDFDMISRFVDSIVRNASKNSQSSERQIRLMLDEANSNYERMAAITALDKHDTALAQKLYKEYSASGLMRQGGVEPFFLKSKMFVASKLKDDVIYDSTAARNIISKDGGVGKNELFWSGLDDLFANNQKVTKAQILDSIDGANFNLRNDIISPETIEEGRLPYADITVEDLVKSSEDEFATYSVGDATISPWKDQFSVTVPGKTPQKVSDLESAVEYLKGVEAPEVPIVVRTLVDGTNYKNTVVTSPRSNYTSPHFGYKKNYLYHYTTEDAGDIRVVLQIQNDASNATSKSLKSAGEIEAPPKTPLTDEYLDHSLKNMVRQAIDEGKTAIAFPTNADQVAKIQQWGTGSFQDALDNADFAKAGYGKNLQTTVNHYLDVLPRKLEKFGRKFNADVVQKEVNGQLMYVMEFSGDMVKAAEEVGFSMFQKGAGSVKGTYDFRNGQHIVSLFKDADPTTAVHEFGHMTLTDLATKDDGRINVVERWAGVEEGSTKKLKENFDVFHRLRESLKGNLDETERAERLRVMETLRPGEEAYRAMHEKFANGMVTYLKNGKAPTPELKNVFEYFKKVLADIWTAVKDTFVEVPEEMIPIYDSLFKLDTTDLKIPRRYSSLGDVPLEVAQKVFDETTTVNIAREMNGAFDVWKMRRGLEAFPEEATKSFDVFKQFLNGKIDGATGEIEAQYRNVMWELEQFSNSVTKYHMGDELMEHLFPAIPDSQIGDSVKTMIAHNKDNMRVFDSMMNAMETMRRDWVRRANGGDLVDALSEREKSALKGWVSKAARNKSDMTDLAVNGGSVTDSAGKVIAAADGALAQTNKVLLDYNTRSNFDQTMRTLFPFWMFPSRSLPFWAETLVTHPQVSSMYFKLKRASEGQRYQAGAIDSSGRPLSSLSGYIKMPGTDMWINPLAPFSFRYILDLAKYASASLYAKPEEETLTGLPYIVKEFMQSAPLIGFNVAPWSGYLLKKAMGIPDSTLPSWSIAPQLNLIPKWAVSPYITSTENDNWFGGGAKSFARYWLFPEPNWQDSLTEQRILQTFQEKAEGMSAAEFKAYREEVVTAISEKGTNELWLATYKELTQEDATRNFAAFFTGAYTKTFTDGAADLIEIKNQNNNLNYAMNNDFAASIMDLPVGDQERWDLRQELKYADTPEGWAARLYKDISWVKNTQGQVVTDPAKRAALLANNIQLTEDSRQAYFDYKDARAKLDKDLATLTRIGSPYEATRPIYEAYYAEIAAIEKRSPEWSGFMGSSRPVALIEKSLTDAWWRIIRTTMPTWKVEDGETYKAYEARIEQWKAELPQSGEALATDSAFGALYTSAIFGGTVAALTEQQKKQFDPAKFMSNLLKMTNAEGYGQYRMANDTVFDAANEAYKIFYWNKFWDTVEGLEGEKRKLAVFDFEKSNPVPNEATIFGWITELYGPRFTLGQVNTLMGATPDSVMSVQERMDFGKSPEEMAQNQIWDLLSDAGPTTHRDLLVKAYLTIAPEDAANFDTWYETSGYGFMNDPDKLFKFRDDLLAASQKIVLKPPTREELQMRVQAEDLNEKFKKLVSDDERLGPTFLQQPDPKTNTPAGIYAEYSGLGEDYYVQKIWIQQNREEYADIQYYKNLRNQYARENPLWGNYYQYYTPVNQQNLDFDEDVPVVEPESQVTTPDTLVPSQPTSRGDSSAAPTSTVSLGGTSIAQKISPIISPIKFPDGFVQAAGEEVVGEILDLVKYKNYLSKPAKDLLYDLARRRRQWRGFIYGILDR